MKISEIISRNNTQNFLRVIQNNWGYLLLYFATLASLTCWNIIYKDAIYDATAVIRVGKALNQNIFSPEDILQILKNEDKYFNKNISAYYSYKLINNNELAIINISSHSNEMDEIRKKVDLAVEKIVLREKKAIKELEINLNSLKTKKGDIENQLRLIIMSSDIFTNKKSLLESIEYFNQKIEEIDAKIVNMEIFADKEQVNYSTLIELSILKKRFNLGMIAIFIVNSFLSALLVVMARLIFCHFNFKSW